MNTTMTKRLIAMFSVTALLLLLPELVWAGTHQLTRDFQEPVESIMFSDIIEEANTMSPESCGDGSDDCLVAVLATDSDALPRDADMSDSNSRTVGITIFSIITGIMLFNAIHSYREFKHSGPMTVQEQQNTIVQTQAAAVLMTVPYLQPGDLVFFLPAIIAAMNVFRPASIGSNYFMTDEAGFHHAMVNGSGLPLALQQIIGLQVMINFWTPPMGGIIPGSTELASGSESTTGLTHTEGDQPISSKEEIPNSVTVIPSAQYFENTSQGEIYNSLTTGTKKENELWHTVTKALPRDEQTGQPIEGSLVVIPKALVNKTGESTWQDVAKKLAEGQTGEAIGSVMIEVQ